jgi:hypothetical protein
VSLAGFEDELAVERPPSRLPQLLRGSDGVAFAAMKRAGASSAERRSPMSNLATSRNAAASEGAAAGVRQERA